MREDSGTGEKARFGVSSSSSLTNPLNCVEHLTKPLTTPASTVFAMQLAQAGKTLGLRAWTAAPALPTAARSFSTFDDRERGEEVWSLTTPFTLLGASRRHLVTGTCL